jgi:3',5'-cyclic AMP phosphodiesterase CpdA
VGIPLLLLGDLAYYSGSTAEFAQCYDPIWGGALKAASYPAPGNHEYVTANASPYYAYFGARAGDPAKGYYSVNFGAWHVIALNSNLPMNAGSAQELWLRADLRAHAARRCKLAYWHHPRFSSSDVHGNDPLSASIWNALYEFKVDVVLNGHDHTYERFAQQTPAQQPDARGIRAFVIGTGGASSYGFKAVPEPNSVLRSSGQFGLVRFDLRDGDFAWQYIPAAGSTLNDSGIAKCNL